MKNILTTLCLFIGVFIQFQLFAQSSWQRSYKQNTSQDVFRAVALLPNGNFLVMGATTVTTGNGQEGAVFEIDPLGNVVTEGCISDPNYQTFHNLMAVTDSSYVLFGAYQQSGSNVDVYMASISHDLTTLYWTHTIGGTNHEIGERGIATQDGGYVGMASSLSFGGGWNTYLYKLNAGGSLVWTRHLGSTGVERYGHVAELPTGQLVVTGLNQSNSAYHDDIGVYWLSSSGTLDSSKIYNVATNDAGYEVMPTLDGGLILTGHLYNSNGSSNNDAYLMKLDGAGAVDWIKGYGGSNWEIGRKLVCLPDSGYIVVGETRSFGGGDMDMYAFRTDKDGVLLWSKAYGGTGYDAAYDVCATGDGGFMIAGQTKSFGAGANYNSYLVKIDGDGHSGGCHEADGGSSWSVSVSHASASVTNGTGGSSGSGGSMTAYTNIDSLYCLDYNGSTGLTCTDAINLDSMDANTVYEMTDTVMWFKFTAENSGSFNFTFEGVGQFYVKEAYAYHYNCGALDTIFQSTIDTAINNSDFLLSLENLKADSTYLVLVKQSIGETSLFTYNSSPKITLCGFTELPTPSYYYKNPTDSCENGIYWNPMDPSWSDAPVRTIRLNFHFLQLNSAPNPSQTNFNEYNSGVPGVFDSINGYVVARELVQNLNNVTSNYQNFGYFPDTTVPILETKLRFELYQNPILPGDSGVYFHEVDSVYYFYDLYYPSLVTNNYSLKELYTVNGEKVVDVWMFAYQDTNILSTDFTNYGSASPWGSAAPGNVNICNLWRFLKIESEYRNFVGLLYHELGHVMGLGHTFSGTLNDCISIADACIYTNIAGCGTYANGCTDVDPVAEKGFSLVPCRDTSNNIVSDSLGNILFKAGQWNNYANNFMGYHAREDFISPCQLGIIHANISNYRPKPVVEECDLNVLNNITLNLPGDTIIWSWPVKVGGHIVIKDSTTLRITCKLQMPEGGKIVVERGAKLIVDGGNISSCLGKMWSGIEVWGDALDEQPKLSYVYPGGATFYQYNQGAVVIVNGSVIEFAEEAVKLYREQSWGIDLAYTGGIVYADSSFFRNNRRSIEFMKYPANFRWREKDYYSVSTITNCTFETTHLLGNGGTPYAHISMWDVHGVKIKNNVFQNLDTIDYSLTQRGKGIVSIDAEFVADSNKFDRLYIGLDVAATKLRPDVFITYDSIVNCLGGIALTTNTFPKVYGNIIAGDQPVSEPGVFGAVGIYNHGNWIPIIEENEVTLPQGNISYGIYSINTGGSPTEIYKNKVWANNGGYAIPNSMNNLGLTIQCNRVESEMDHFLVFNGGIAEFQGICGGSRVAQNRFNSSCSSSNLHFYLSSNSLPFKYNHPGGIYGPNGSCVIGLNPVNYQPCFMSNFNQCNSRIDTFEVIIDSIFLKKDTLKQIIQGEAEKLDHGITNTMIAKVRNPVVTNATLMDSLEAFNGMVSDDLLLAVMFERTTFDRDDLAHILIKNAPHTHTVWNEILHLTSPLPPDSLTKLAQWQDSTSARKPIADSIGYYRIQNALLYGQLFHIIAADTSFNLEQVMDSLYTETDPYLLIILADYLVEDSQFVAANAIYDTVNAYTKELQSLLVLKKINLTFEENNWTWFDITGEGEATEYEDSIRLIAEADSSVAAIQAQVILNLVFGDTITRIWEEKEMVGSKWQEHKENEEEGNITNEKTESVKIYPNPAQNILYIESLYEGEQTLRLYSLMGKLLLEKDIITGTTEIMIDHLENGFYIYSVGKGQLVDSGKLSILR